MANTIQLRRGTSDVVVSGGGETAVNTGEPLVYLPSSGDQKLYIAKSGTAGDVVWMGAPITTDGTSSSATKLMTASAVQAAIDAEDTLAEMGDTDISSLSSGHIIVYDGSDSFDNVAVSGDATLAANGALSIGNQKVTNTMLADDAVGADELAANAVVSASIVDGTIATGDIADNAITAAKFNISGNGTSGQIIQTDGDGSFSYTNAASANDSTITLTAGDGLQTGGSFTTNASGNSEITFNFDASDVVAANSGMAANGENLEVDINNLTAATLASGDFIAFSDEGESGDPTRKESIDDVATLFAGDGLTASSAVLAVNVDDSSIETNSDAIRVKASGVTNAMLAGSIAISKLASDDVTIAADSGTAHAIDLGETLTVSGTSNEVETSISNNTLTIGLPNNVTIGGNLTVSGTTTTVASTTVAIADSMLKLAKDQGSSADDLDFGVYGQYGTGGTAKYAGIFRDVSATGNAFTFFDELQAEPGTTVNTSGTGYALAPIIAGEITGTLQTAAQTNITSVGALGGGSISSGFGNIDNGSSTITTTGLISGGSLDIDNVLINGTTIGHTDDTDLMTVANGLLTVAGEISVTTLDIGGTNVTSTAAELNILDGVTSTATELNIMDGDTSASSTTVADADRVVFNDNGTMKQVAVTDLAAYFDDEITAMPNLVQSGALNARTITSGFGNINNGSSTITTTGLISGGSLDIDNVLINGTTIGHTDDTDLMTVADGLLTVAGEISVTTLDIGGVNVSSTAAELNILDGVTSTATELNIMDGDTSATSTTLASADRMVMNDAGTMKQVALSALVTYLENGSTSGFNIDGGAI